jgi:hypothetical protein
MQNLKNSDQESFKINLPNSMERESKLSGNSSLYKNEYSKEGKKMRMKIRKIFENIRNDFFGKDRKDSERLDAIQRGLLEYRRFHLIQDFKIENFSQSRNELILKESSILLSNMESFFKSNLKGDWKGIDAKIKKGE